MKSTRFNLTMALVLAVLMILAACQPSGIHRETSDPATFTYEIIHIEGMPCLVVDYAPTSSVATFGITCDW